MEHSGFVKVQFSSSGISSGDIFSKFGERATCNHQLISYGIFCLS